MLLLLLFLVIESGEASLMQAGFVSLPQRPSADDLRCANYSRAEWTLSSLEDRLRVVARADTDVADPLPFRYARHQDRTGNRHVVKVTDGWLVGFDAGEFGGGLWWFSNDGERSRRLRPPSGAPAHPNDIFRAENVHGFAHFASGEAIVFMGLDHLVGRSGRVFKVVQRANGWVLAPVAALDASPMAWVADGDRLLVLTESGLWHVTLGAPPRRLHELDIGRLYPQSLVADRDGALYAGMRRYVLRLTPTDSGWTETWFVKSNCVRARIADYECECVP